MNSDGNSGFGGALHGGFEWVTMLGLGAPSEMLWRCEVTRAGRLYSSNLFDTREEAENFARSMREAEPDQMFNVEAIKASKVWD